MSYLSDRRRKLAELLPNTAVLLYSGAERPRNYPANTYPYRPDSHFVYFAGGLPPGSFCLLFDGRADIFTEKPSLDSIVWTGAPEDFEVMAQRCDAYVHELQELPEFLKRLSPPVLAALPTQDPSAQALFDKLLGRFPNPANNFRDAALAQAIVDLRLYHDETACQELRRGGRISVECHLAAMRRLANYRPGMTELSILAALDEVRIENGCEWSFNPIVTVNGQYLHQVKLGAPLKENDLLLIDYGVESETCWSGDISNTLPVSGKFTPLQREVYSIVWQAHSGCAAMLRPGVRWTEVHQCAYELMADGLRTLGLLQGSMEEIKRCNVMGYFMPHGVGHLLGMDVHDLEDLGDLAGYAPGRSRSTKMGWQSLRLDRDLAPGMAVTVEPGLYFIPELLQSRAFEEECSWVVNRQKLEELMEIHGIRIERDYLITKSGAELLTPGMPGTADEIEAFMKGSRP